MRPLRRSRARFPLLSPTATSSPGAGEVFPQRGSQDLKSVAKVSGAMTKYMGVLLALPLGEVASPQAMTERAHAGKNPFRLAAARQATFPKGTAFCSGGKLSGKTARCPTVQKTPSQALPRQLPQGGSQDLKSVAKASGAVGNFAAAPKGVPLGELARRKP